MSRIFVSIPSFRDPECQYTIRDLLDKAAHPNNISVGVCFQAHFDEDDATCFNDWPESLFDDQIRLDKVDCKLATGPCWARHRAQQLWRGEEYFLSIDSHTRFIQNWDDLMLAELAKCPSNKAILTTYPVGYERGKPTPTDIHSTFTVAQKFGPEGMLRLTGKRLAKVPSAPLPSMFWVSGYAFSSSDVLKEVPYDPHLQYIFFGEESSMTVRLWTHGWDFFAPTSNFIWHLWSRSYRPVFRENKLDEEQERLSFLRIKIQLNMVSKEDVNESDWNKATVELQKYTVGLERTVSDYENISGVRFKDGKLTELATSGNVSPDMFADTVLASLLAGYLK